MPFDARPLGVLIQAGLRPATKCLRQATPLARQLRQLLALTFNGPRDPGSANTSNVCSSLCLLLRHVEGLRLKLMQRTLITLVAWYIVFRGSEDQSEVTRMSSGWMSLNLFFSISSSVNPMYRPKPDEDWEGRGPESLSLSMATRLVNCHPVLKIDIRSARTYTRNYWSTGGRETMGQSQFTSSF